MIKHILVPTDGSEPARAAEQYAINMAKKFQAVIHALHVVDIKLLEGPFLRDISSSLGQEPFANHQGRIAMILEERGRAALEAVANACEEAGVTCKTEQITGLVVRTIVEKSDLADIVVMGRSGEHNEWLEGLLGSTTDSVARRTERPLIVTGNPQPGFGKIVVAYDASHHAHGALKTAVGLVREWGASLEVLTVGEESGERVLQEARDYVQPHNLEVQYHVRGGDPAESIVAYAKEAQADLLVIGTFGHNVVRDFFLGSTAAYILNHAPCPLLVAP